MLHILSTLVPFNTIKYQIYVAIQLVLYNIYIYVYKSSENKKFNIPLPPASSKTKMYCIFVIVSKMK